MKKNHPFYLSFRIYIVGIITSSFLLGSCIPIRQKYPSDWGGLISLEENQRCPDISGIYYNTGLSGSDWISGKSEASLSDLFLFVRYRFDVVQFKHLDDGTLEIIAWDEEVRSKKTIPAEKYSCALGAIKIPYKRDSASEIGGAWEWGSYYLTKSTDGCLVVRDQDIEFGVVAVPPFIVFPIAVTQTSWYRFRPEGYEIERSPSEIERDSSKVD